MSDPKAPVLDHSADVGQPRGFQSVVVQTLTMVVLFVVVERSVRWMGALPEQAYRGPVIAVGLFWRGLAACVVGAGVYLLVPGAYKDRLRRLGDDWSSVEHGRALRWLIGFAAAILAWTFATYAYNLFFDQAHLVDRVLLVVAFAFVLWRPIALLPFTILLVAVVGQLEYPLEYPWTEVNYVVRILWLFLVAFALARVSGDRRMDVFVFVLCCLIATNYWWSGWGKMQIGWISHRHLNLLLLGAYAHGWLQWLSPETVVSIAQRIAPFNTVLMTFTLVVEWGAVVLLWRRWTLVGFLAGAVAFHSGIFAFTGMLFWKWILMEIAMLAFLLHRGILKRLPIFTPVHLVLSVVLILGCRAWVTPTNLTWYDTPLTYTVRLNAVSPAGNEYEIPTYTTAPYSDLFFLGLFQYLTDTPRLTSVMGAIGPPHSVADSLLDATRAADVLALERHAAPAQVDAERAARFDRFVAGIAMRINERGMPRPGWTRILRAPRHLWNQSGPGSYSGQEPIQQVGVDVVLTWYDGTAITEIARRRVREIDVAASAP